MKTLHTKAKLLTRELLDLEKCGRYEEALAEVRHIWEDTTALPNTDDFEPQTAAEIILRCGSLIGFLGHIKQIPNAQEKSKNLLTEAYNRFLDIYQVEKIAECANYLALAYWRAGELVEAETWIEEALSYDLRPSNRVRLYSHVIKSMILLLSKKYEDVCSRLTELEDDFLNYADDFLKGSFYNNYGLALKNLGKIDAAFPSLESGRDYYVKSGNKFHCGLAENNLAQLYKSQNKFTQAHKAIDNATKIFRKIKDKTREGFSLDTKAQIYFVEKKYSKALETIEKALTILGKGENAAYLIETYLTKVKILLYLDDFSAATLCLSDAVQLAKTRISEKAALNLVKEFELVLEEKTSRKADENFSEEKSTDGNLQLILPPSLAHYQQIEVIRIQNEHLEEIGLKKGSLAIVVNEKIKRGDLTAVSERETDLVICGFYDSEFGIICLDGIKTEPQLFDEENVKILGRIVGVCSSETDGKMIVEPINL